MISSASQTEQTTSGVGYWPNSVNVMSTRTYMASPVPRSIRQKRLSHLHLDCVIGYLSYKDDSGLNSVFDIIMLPVREFHRVKLLAGLQYSPTITPSPGGNVVGSAYVLTNIKSIKAPDSEPDAKALAKAYCIKAFGAKT